MATHTHTTSRRRLLSAAAPAALALSGAAAAPVAPNPDAELISLCAEFEAMERKRLTAFVGIETDADQDRADAMTAAIDHEQAPIVAAITACRPTTLAGFTVLANVATLWNPELVSINVVTQGDTGERLLRVLLRGMLGRAAA